MFGGGGRFAFCVLQEMMSTAFELYRIQGKYCDAVRVALRMDDPDLLAQLLAECEDKHTRQQMR